MQHLLDECYKIYPQWKDGVPKERVMEFIYDYFNQDTIDMDEYIEMHPTPLTETDMDIDVNHFLQEIEQYSDKFDQWGPRHTQFPRYGIPLVNMTGSLDENPDPSRMPLDEYFMRYNKEGDIIFDDMIREKTQVCNMSSLSPLHKIFPHLTRSAILKWDIMGHFKPHIDVVLPAPILRLWGTTSTNIVLKMDRKVINNIKPGKIYLIDTSLIHEAFATADGVYQFFLSCDIAAKDILKESII